MLAVDVYQGVLLLTCWGYCLYNATALSYAQGSLVGIPTFLDVGFVGRVDVLCLAPSWLPLAVESSF